MPNELADAAAEEILSHSYERQRSAPSVGDPLYIHLSDLESALRAALAGVTGKWLDYGSNNSPYRPFFCDATLECADVRHVPGITYVIPPGRPCPAPDGGFDGILSTQVLEHVEDVPACLGDCLRMLRPAGRLVLTTHGIWQDHGCPGDYWRWTADGLRLELERSGFVVERCVKLSADMRAYIQLSIMRAGALRMVDRGTPLGMAIHLFGRWLCRYYGVLARYADRRYAHQRATEDPGAKIYLGVLALAHKPG